MVQNDHAAGTAVRGVFLARSHHNFRPAVFVDITHGRAGLDALLAGSQAKGGCRVPVPLYPAGAVHNQDVAVVGGHHDVRGAIEVDVGHGRRGAKAVAVAAARRADGAGQGEAPAGWYLVESGGAGGRPRGQEQKRQQNGGRQQEGSAAGGAGQGGERCQSSHRQGGGNYDYGRGTRQMS